MSCPSSSSGDDDDAAAGFLDLEAQESSGDNDSRSDDTSALDAPLRTRGRGPFHGFAKLPPELRCRIWEYFCPDLVPSPRLLQFVMSPASAACMVAHRTEWPTHNLWTVKEGLTLADQTEPLRRVMATHRHSRAVAARVFPDTLSIDSGSGDALVHFHRDRDVVLIQNLEREDHLSCSCSLLDFRDKVVNVALRKRGGGTNLPVRGGLRLLPNLKRLYFWKRDESYHENDLRWCVSDCVHQYLTQTFQVEPGLGEDTQCMACWPNVDGHPEFARSRIPQMHMKGWPEYVEKVQEDHGIELWPMVIFELEKAMDRYEMLKWSGQSPGSDQCFGHSDDSYLGSGWSDPETDEYESEGIDDTEIVFNDDSSEDDIIPDGYLPLQGLFPPDFSIPEPGTDQDDDVDDDASAVGAPDPTGKRSKRQIIVDSDDDDDSATNEPMAKRARTGRATIVDSDDEADEAPASGWRVMGSRQRPDDKSDDDSGGAAPTEIVEANFSDLASDSDDGRTSNQGAASSERMRLYRESSCVLSSDSEEPSAQEDEGDGQEEEDDDEEGNDDSGDGIMDVMADESDDDDGGDSDSEGGWG